MTRLAQYTSMHIGAEPRSLALPTSEQELIDVIASADREGRPIVILGGGSNVLFSDDFAGDVVRVSHTGLENDESACAGAWVTVQAGHEWDDVVNTAVHAGWTGIEALSGIPGTAGA